MGYSLMDVIKRLFAHKSAPAGATIAVVTYPIPVHVESASSGLFIELVQAVAKEAGLSVRISVLPPPRAIASFTAGHHAVLFPALDVLFPPGASITRSREVIDHKEDFVFTRRDGPQLSSLTDLVGLRVGITRGYPYAREVCAGHDFFIEAADSDEANLELLAAGHIDAFILDEKTGVRAIARAGLDSAIQHAADRPVSREEVYYAFQPTPDGRQLAEAFSNALARLKADGRYRAITRGITYDDARRT